MVGKKIGSPTWVESIFFVSLKKSLCSREHIEAPHLFTISSREQ